MKRSGWRSAMLATVLALLLQAIGACGGGGDGNVSSGGNNADGAGSTAASSAPRYDGATLNLKGLSIGPQPLQQYCGAAATVRCYQPQRIGLWVRNADAAALQLDLLLFGLHVIERVIYDCGGSDRHFMVLGVPEDFELQWLVAARLFLTIVSALIVPAPIAASDPYNDPAQVAGFICRFARAS